MKALFEPRSVAVIGASQRNKSVGYGVVKSLVSGGVFKTKYAKSFKGKIYPINPKTKNILGQKCYSDITQVSGIVDLAIICVPAKIVLPVIKQCVKKKVKFAVIISAGFGELGAKGKKLQENITKVAKKGKLRVVGPNCLGIINTHHCLNASFAPTMPPKGEVSFITQSGALADSIIDWEVKEAYGMDKLISLGNQSDLNISDFLEYLGNDKTTKAIAVYIEGLKDGRRFLHTAKKVVKKKPIVVIKAGRSSSGSRAVSSHTGSLAGSYKIYEAAMKQAGIEVAKNVEELFEIAKAFSMQPSCDNGIGIITNGGGCGVLCADACEENDIEVVPFKEKMLRKIDKKMHPAYSRHNPLDIVGDALPERYEIALDAVLAEPYVKGAIVIQTLQTMTDGEANAKVVIKMHRKYPKKPILCCFMGGWFSAKGIRVLEEGGIPNFEDVSRAARVMKALIGNFKR